MTYNDAGTRQIPGNEFDTVLEILRLEREGKTYTKISERTGIPIATVCE